MREGGDFVALRLRALLKRVFAADTDESRLDDMGLGMPDDPASERNPSPCPGHGGDRGAFLRKCVGCLRCLRACPSGILRASSGSGRFPRPTMDFRKGWCRPGCDACAKSCPTGAISGIGDSRHAGSRSQRIPRWNAQRCIAARGDDPCHACERHCPVHAITLEKSASGRFPVPRVDLAKCIGCGACEYHCPSRPLTAMCMEGRSE